jgi:ABC-type Mn2+/Zn2+ transport system ATPase subunit
MSEVVLEAAGLALGYDGPDVLRDVTLTIRAGEFWFLLGPNGGGKTTLLRAFVGTLPPRAGVLRRDPALAGRDQTGYVPQRCDLNPALPTTVREFVVLGTVGLRISRTEEAARLAAALEHVGLSDLARRDYWALSGGQRQRALVARALVRRPRLLLLDEPTNHLDLGTEDALLRLLAGLNRDQRVTTVFVTHNVALAARYATHVALVWDGRVLSGPCQQILGRRDLAEIFGVEVELTDEGLRLRSGASPR